MQNKYINLKDGEVYIIRSTDLHRIEVSNKNNANSAYEKFYSHSFTSKGTNQKEDFPIVSIYNNGFLKPVFSSIYLNILDENFSENSFQGTRQKFEEKLRQLQNNPLGIYMDNLKEVSDLTDKDKEEILNDLDNESKREQQLTKLSIKAKEKLEESFKNMIGFDQEQAEEINHSIDLNTSFKAYIKKIRG